MLKISTNHNGHRGIMQPIKFHLYDWDIVHHGLSTRKRDKGGLNYYATHLEK